jgi:uncharacterized tellurite resistance protein B-like protein
MLNALREIFRKVSASDEQPHFDPDDERLALAALMIHCMSIDGAISETERDKLRAVLTNSFGLAGADLDLLIADAIAAEQEAVDLYRFTSVLKRQLSVDQRIRVVENLWEMVFADGESHEFEENLVWRVAELLSVSREDRIAKRRTVAENRSSLQGDAS